MEGFWWICMALSALHSTNDLSWTIHSKNHIPLFILKAPFDTQHYNFFLLALPFIVTVSVERICYNLLFICRLNLVFEYSSHYANPTQIPNVTLLIGIFNNGLSVSGSEISHEYVSFVLDTGDCAFNVTLPLVSKILHFLSPSPNSRPSLLPPFPVVLQSWCLCFSLILCDLTGQTQPMTFSLQAQIVK